MNQALFIDFLMKLADQGETVLIVRQKPLIRNGEPLRHADGTPKYSWPAYLPTHTFKPDAALYGNTGSFILDRFDSGRPSASAVNCEYVICLILDDVSTKSKVPPIAPTWIMETSPENYQYGYVFSEQPTKHEYSAAIRAIADAGYTDPGAVNPVRNFRIPGSVNLKADKGGFVSRLVEFHPDREFTLEAICEALGVTPAEADSAAVRAIRLSDTGADDVLTWLSGQGRVLSRPNAEGWCGVVCPNAAQHSDGNPEARYLPVTRAFCCYHGHCEDWDSRRFLEWVAEQGGPKHDSGLRDDLIAAVMTETLDKLTPTEAFPNEAAQIIQEVDMRELGRAERATWFTRFCYIEEDDAYFDLDDRRELRRPTFNAIYRHVQCRSIHNPKQRIEASVFFDQNRVAMGARSLAGITFAAGESVLCARDGLVYANRWRNARPEGRPGDVTPWLQHVERMLPDADEREHVLNVMAFKRQRPNVKVNHAILHAGISGSGKDTMWYPMFYSIGGKSLTNVQLVRNDEVNSQWGYSMESEVMVINELRQPEAKDRRALENTLKPLLAAPPEYLPINRKGLHPYNALNRLQVIAFSNERAAISLPSDDRRWFVVWSSAPRMDKDAARALWGWYESVGFDAIAAWLDARDVSAFNPGAAPPMTEAKMIMIESAMSTAEAFLVDAIRQRDGDFARGVVGSPFFSICERLQARAPTGVKVVPAALMHALREAEWVDCGRFHSRDYQTKKHVFCAPELTSLPKAELRRLAEPSAPPALSVVPGRVNKDRGKDKAD